MIANPNPIGLKFLSEMPKCNVNPSTCDTDPNGAVNNFYQPGLDPTTRRDSIFAWTGRKSEKQRIFGRFSFDRLFTSTYNAFGNMWDLNYAQNVTNGRNILLADDLTLSPTTVLSVALLLHPPLREPGWRSPAGWIRHHHAGLSLLRSPRRRFTSFFPS